MSNVECPLPRARIRGTAITKAVAADQGGDLFSRGELNFAKQSAVSLLLLRETCPPMQQCEVPSEAQAVSDEGISNSLNNGFVDCLYPQT